jgi:hypothetical protein
LQVQDSVLRALYSWAFAGVSPLHPTREHSPLDPILKVFSLTHPERVQRGFAPLQVQDSVLRALYSWAFAGVSPLHPTRGTLPLTPS